MKPLDGKKKDLFQLRAAVFKALAHPTRLWIVEQLAGGERCVCEFVKAVNADFSTVSKHLTILKQAGLIEDDKRGKQVFYRLTIPCVMDFMRCVEKVLKTRARAHARVLGPGLAPPS